MQKVFSQHCENNKHPIKNVLIQTFKNCQQVLEIGSGTGQHAIFFAEHLPQLIWHTSDQADYISILEKQLLDAKIKNISQPLTLDVTQPWPIDPKTHTIDGIFTANSLHIMSEEMVKAFFKGVGSHLSKGGQLCIYGPFNYDGKFSSESNATFDLILKERNPLSGIRDFNWLCELASVQGLEFKEDFKMPANNRILHFEMT